MSTMQEKVNGLYWETQGVNATMKRKLFLTAFIEIHNNAVEEVAGRMSRIHGSDLTDEIRRELIEVPE